MACYLDDKPLKSELRNFVVPLVATKWKDIGIGLGIADDDEGDDFLEELTGESEECCMKVFTRWLRKSKPHLTTWKRFFSVLEAQGMRDVVQSVKDRKGSQAQELLTSPLAAPFSIPLPSALGQKKTHDMDTSGPPQYADQTSDPTADLCSMVDDPSLEELLPEADYSLKDGYQLREYQKELAQPGINGENYIMISPTGSGKTLVAAQIISHHLQQHHQHRYHDPCPRCHVVFVVTTKPLAEQQNKVLAKYIPGAKVDVYTGDTKGKLVATSIKENNITVCTAGKLLDEIRKNIIHFYDLCLVIFDECHHTKKGHPYARLMENYLEERDENRMPQVIGMTASPGAGDNTDHDMKKTADHLMKLAALMNATSGLVRVTKNVEELQRYSKSSSTTCKTLQSRDVTNEPFINKVITEMSTFECSDMKKCSLNKWSQEYETKVQQLKQTLEMSPDKMLRDRISTLRLLRCYSNALNIYRDLRQTDAIKVMEEYITNEFSADDANLTRHERTMKVGMKKLIGNLKMLENVNNPLLDDLEKILCAKFIEDSSSRAIIFVRTKKHAFAMNDWIRSSSQFSNLKIVPDVITGHTRETGEGMTQVTQEQVMSNFREGKAHLLIATSVAEEGLDVPACNLVIRYLHVSNEIAMVQTEGRARADDSDCYTILSSDSKKKYQEMKNYELNALVEKFLEDGLFPTGKHWEEKRKELQQKICDSRKLRSLLFKEKKVNDKAREVGLACKKCKITACYGSDIYTIGEEDQFHYVVPDPKFKDKITTKPHPKPADLIHDKVSKTHKIYCSNCEQDWGVMCIWPIDGHQFPVIKCANFIFKINGQIFSYKKWRDVQFKMDCLSSWLALGNESDNSTESD